MTPEEGIRLVLREAPNGRPDPFGAFGAPPRTYTVNDGVVSLPAGIRLTTVSPPPFLIFSSPEPCRTGAVMNVRPIGVLQMEDDAGPDEKIIAVPAAKLTQRYVHVKNITDLPRITLEQIQHFFEHYKDLEPGKWVRVKGWGNIAEAHRLITEAVERHKISG